MLYTYFIFNFVTLISAPVFSPPKANTLLHHCPTAPHRYSSICTMATVNRTVTGIKDEKLVWCVLVEQLKDTDRTEGVGIKKG